MRIPELGIRTRILLSLIVICMNRQLQCYQCSINSKIDIINFEKRGFNKSKSIDYLYNIV